LLETARPRAVRSLHGRSRLQDGIANSRNCHLAVIRP
jgi:hypothetical protein